MRKGKGKPDLRCIHQNRCYSVQEGASLLGVSVGTFRSWIRKGLPILQDIRPILVPGDGLKAWLKARTKARKCRCQPDELYCCRCRSPQKAKPGSVELIPKNGKTVAIRALCNSCGTKMNKAGSLAKVLEIETAFGLNTHRQENLEVCENPAVNQHLEKDTAK